MAAVTLYRFRIDVSDLDRAFYGEVDFRVAMHPSETMDYLLTRVFAFCLNAPVEFAPEGLSDPDVPALSRAGVHGSIDLWIEIGNPSARKAHRASKAASLVRIYTYKDARALVKELAEVPRAGAIEAFAFDAAFLSSVPVERDNRWNLLVQDGTLSLSSDTFSTSGDMKRVSLVP